MTDSLTPPLSLGECPDTLFFEVFELKFPDLFYTRWLSYLMCQTRFKPKCYKFHSSKTSLEKKEDSFIAFLTFWLISALWLKHGFHLSCVVFITFFSILHSKIWLEYNFCFRYTDFIKLECRLIIAMSPMFLVRSFMTLYTSLLDEIKGQATAEGSNRMSSGQVLDCYSN